MESIHHLSLLAPGRHFTHDDHLLSLIHLQKNKNNVNSDDDDEEEKEGKDDDDFVVEDQHNYPPPKKTTHYIRDMILPCPRDFSFMNLIGNIILLFILHGNILSAIVGMKCLIIITVPSANIAWTYLHLWSPSSIRANQQADIIPLQCLYCGPSTSVPPVLGL
ncbi:hypothetical protein Tco_0683254 [Tanacetum coccineum]|uniref:Uncharacterized protein n=1 Tax=Tanacetum coccineum TaxID=301880 RepID=A0ABQ4XTG5_9ASTR